MGYTSRSLFYDFGCSEALNRHKFMFFEGYITLDLDSAEVFCGIGIFCRFFALQDFSSNRRLKKVWADPPTAMRFRVKDHAKYHDFFPPRLWRTCV
jgi:hypothetical protein